MGKRLLLQPRGAAAAAGRRRRAGQHGQGHARAEGPQRRARAPDRRADHHQRRRVDRARDRARRPVQEHGRPARARGRQQDQRPHRRRHDDRHAAGPGDRARGHARARRRAPTRCSCGAGSSRRPSCWSAELRRMARPVEGRDDARPRGDDRRQGGRGDRRGRGRRARPRRPRGRRDDRGERRARHRGATSATGMLVENGWVSPYMVRDQERMETVFEDPHILMTNKPISHPNDLLPTLDLVMKDPRPLVDPGREGRRRRARHARRQQPAPHDRGGGGARARVRAPAHPAPRRPRRLHRRRW